MDDCENCIHKKVCDLWRKQELQDAGCFFIDGCELFESAKSLGMCGGRKSQEEETEQDRDEFSHGDTNFRNEEIFGESSTTA